MFFNNKLLVSIGTFGIVSAAGGFVYYSTKSLKNEKNLSEKPLLESVVIEPKNEKSQQPEQELQDKSLQGSKGSTSLDNSLQPEVKISLVTEESQTSSQQLPSSNQGTNSSATDSKTDSDPLIDACDKHAKTHPRTKEIAISNDSYSYLDW